MKERFDEARVRHQRLIRYYCESESDFYHELLMAFLGLLINKIIRTIEFQRIGIGIWKSNFEPHLPQSGPFKISIVCSIS